MPYFQPSPPSPLAPLPSPPPPPSSSSSSSSSPQRTGYLAASQSFHEGLDVVMLTTNMIRKDISSSNLYDSSLALSGLGCFMTPDLARDLANDVLTLTASSRPYLRKKAIIIMYKVFLKVIHSYL